MRILLLLLINSTLLFGCSMNSELLERSSENEEITQSENSATEPTKLTEEEKLVQNLPKDSSLEDWNLLLVGPQYALPETFEPRDRKSVV